MPHRTVYREYGDSNGAHYTDYGPNPNAQVDRQSSTAARSAWANRPMCDMCGPFRGRYLRPIGQGEHRCFGCDAED